MADRYWVGGSATWNATAGTKWALTSGGAGGQAVPTSADDVYFDAGSGAVAVTIGSGVSCKNLSFTSGAGNFTGSLAAGTSTLNCYGNLTAISGLVSLWTGLLNFASTTSQTITTNGFSFDNPITFNGVGGSWQLVDNLTTGSTRTVTLTNGMLDLNSKTLTCGTFSSSNSNIRSIAFGSGNITCTINNANVFTATTGTNLTYTGTPTVNCTYSGSTGTRVISGPSTDGSAANAFNFNISAGSDIVSFGTSERTVGNVNFTGFTGSCSEAPKGVYGDLTFVSGMTVASTGTTTFRSTTGTKTITTAGLTLDFPITFNGIGGTWSFADALTQGSTRAFTITNGTVKLKAGATSIVGAFATSGSNQKYLQSTLAGSTATLSQASGTVTVTNLTIQDITATGGATWQAFLTSGNVNNGNNTGWDWYYEPGEYMYTRRKTKRLLIQ